MRKILGLVLVLTVLFGYSAVAEAAVFVGGESYTLTERKVINENIYVGAANVVVAGNINGDAHLAGGTVLVSGNISEDLSIAGGSVNILGNVGEDVRALGGNIVIKSNIGGDLILTGGSVIIAPGVVVQGDVVLAGGDLLINGDIKRDLVIAGGSVVLNGTVNGNVRAFTDEKFEIGDGAVLRGNLTYTSVSDIEINEGARITGEVIQEESLGHDGSEGYDKGYIMGFFGSLMVLKVIGLFILAMLALYISRRQSKALVTAAIGSFWKPVLVGIGVAIATPVVALILMATIIGIPVGIMLLALYVVTLITAAIFVGPVFGVVIRKVIKKTQSVVLNWKTVLVGIVGLMIVAWIPFVGCFIGLVFYALTVGAVAIRFSEGVWSKR